MGLRVNSNIASLNAQRSLANTTEHLQALHARLAVIDSAQKNITELATQVSSLQSVLANKQSRGAFGQGQLEAIITDVLPMSMISASDAGARNAVPIFSTVLAVSGRRNCGAGSMRIASDSADSVANLIT